MPHDRANQTHIIPFIDFVSEFLSETLTWMDHVPGLRPQVEACSVCDIKWDFVVKLESWAEDFEVKFSHFRVNFPGASRNHKILQNLKNKNFSRPEEN